MHITILKKGEMPCISKCTQCCDEYHCPFCETWVYKPRGLGSVVNHVQNHLKLAVQLHDFSIIKCNLKCRENAHFHCCYCSATILRKAQLQIHLSNCIQKLTAEGEFEENCSLDGSPKHEQFFVIIVFSFISVFFFTSYWFPVCYRLFGIVVFDG